MPEMNGEVPSYSLKYANIFNPDEEKWKRCFFLYILYLYTLWVAASSSSNRDSERVITRKFSHKSRTGFICKETHRRATTSSKKWNAIFYRGKKRTEWYSSRNNKKSKAGKQVCAVNPLLFFACEIFFDDAQW
jgi:hypothetical protein